MATKKKAENATHKIRIIVKAFEHKVIDEAVTKIVSTAKDSGAIVV
jgi:ribosomal protein S10